MEKKITFRCEITTDAEGIHVKAIAQGVKLDRTQTAAWGLKPAHKTLAQRLCRAIEAGAALTPIGVRTDIGGQTYLATTGHVMGRYMNADLRRLGY